MRNRFDLTAQQYHAGLDKLWAALGLTTTQEEDVFTLSARAAGSWTRLSSPFVRPIM